MKESKEQSFRFCVDSRLRITSWDEGNKGISVPGATPALGRKYYEIFPRIFCNDGDAVSHVLRNNRTKTFKGYILNCLNGQTRADIKLRPLKASQGNAIGVEVAITPHEICPTAARMHDLQQIIDIGKTAATLAHGVRSPLNAIKGAVLFLREKYAQEPTLVEFTKIMEDEISQLDNFISRFLSTSLTAGDLTETDINGLLKKIELYTTLQVQSNNITCAYEYGDIPLVMISPFQLEQAILNIINNSIEAMGSRGRLTVKTRCESRAGIGFIVIEISDTGSGMPREQMQGLSRLPGDRRKGKGFGMFITREILQFYGGHLEIKNKKGTGTTVKLYLPLRKSDKR